MFKEGVTLFLMTQKGFAVLKSLSVDQRSMIDVVVVGGDSNIESDYRFEIIEYCQDHAISWVARSDFSEVKSKYVLAVSWRWLIDHRADRLIVLHDSLLPRYRGFAPLVNSLINGESYIGVTALFGADNYDEGEIIKQSRTKISYPLKIGDAIDLVINNYIDLVQFIFSKLLEGSDLESYPQPDIGVSYSIWRDREDYFVDWNESSKKIRRVVDALGAPYDGAQTKTSEHEVIRLDDVEEVEDVVVENRDVGKVIFFDAGCPVVICGVGLLKIVGARKVVDGDFAEVDFKSRFRIRFGS